MSKQPIKMNRLLFAVTASFGGMFLAATSSHADIDVATGLEIKSSDTFTYLYEMDAHPGVVDEIDLDNDGNRDFLGNLGMKNSGVAGSVNGSTITLDTERPSPNELFLAQTGNNTIWDSTGFGSGAFTVEVRLRIDEGDFHFDVSQGSSSVAWLNLHSDGQSWGFVSGTNSVGAIDLGQNDNTDAFHTFRIAFVGDDNGGEFWVWRNDILLNGGQPLGDGFTAANLNRFLLGSPNSDTGIGVTEVDYIRITGGAYAAIPEPASAVLFAMSGLTLLARRRRTA